MGPPSPFITNLDASGCTLGAIDRVLGTVAAGKCDSHAAILERFWLGEDPKIDRIARRADGKRFGDAVIVEAVAFPVAEDHRRSRGADKLDRWDRKPEDRAQVKLELVRELRNERDHPGIVRTRAQFGEDRLVSADEEFDAEDAMPAKRLHDFSRLMARRLERALRDGGRLPAFAIVASLLPVADRSAEQDAVLGRHGEESDLAVELDEFLDDHARPVAAHILDRIIPCLADVRCGL